jgi:U4/U6.U5 tri-snRNP component SNU23
MSGKGKASGVDNTARRVWDREEYSDKAKERQDQHDTQLITASDNPALDARKRKRLERDPLHQGIIVQRATLRARDQQIDLAANLNRTQMVSAGAHLSAQGGFYCEVCDAVLKDSHAWLDHLNGKWHNRALGMSMTVEKSTLEQVKARIQKKKEQVGNRTTDGDNNGNSDDDNREAKNKTFLFSHVPDGVTKEDIEREEEKARQEEDEGEEDDDEMDPDLAAMMGFSGFAAGN